MMLKPSHQDSQILAGAVKLFSWAVLSASFKILQLFILSLTLLIHFQLEIATLVFIMLVFIVFMETMLKIMKMFCTLQQL